jgi:hypothetical protein
MSNGIGPEQVRNARENSMAFAVFKIQLNLMFQRSVAI